MKIFLAFCAAAGLSGCAVYPSPGYDTYGYDVPPPQVIQQPVYVYGGGGGAVYRPDGFGYGYPRGYSRPYPPPVVVVPGQIQPRTFGHGSRPGRGYGDRDRDGIPNRFDRHPNRSDQPHRVERSQRPDRDGDGIPDRVDPRPNIPNRR